MENIYANLLKLAKLLCHVKKKRKSVLTQKSSDTLPETFNLITRNKCIYTLAYFIDKCEENINLENL